MRGTVRRRGPVPPITAAVALSLAVTGTAAAQDRGPSFPALPADAPAGIGVTERCELGVEGTARCGVYRVWEDREARSGRTVDIAFVVLEALDPGARQDDAVTFFGGGPGSTVIPGAPAIARSGAPHRRARDIVLFDFRGTGRSGALTCDVPYPRGMASRFGTVFPVDHIRACRDALSVRADLSWYRTDATVDDVDEIRRWLGYSALNIMGGSYGTREAQVYIRRHPDAVRTAVLNGIGPVSRSTYLHTAPSLQGALEAVFADCRRDPSCAEAYPDLERRFDEVIARLDRETPMVEVRGVRVPFSRGDLAYALRGLLYGRSSEVPYWIDQAWRGRWKEIAAYYAGRTDWVSDPAFAAGYHFSALCAEDMIGVDPAEIARVSAGTFMNGHLIRGYWEACLIWPAAVLPDGFHQPVRSDTPTLLLSGGRDPATPAHFAEEVARHLSNSVSIVVPGGGHGVSGPCIEAMRITLIETGSVAGLDTSCVEAVRPPAFRLPERR